MKRPTRNIQPPVRQSDLLGGITAWLSGLICICVLPSACSASDATPRIPSGVYEGMMLAIDKDGTLTGYFRQEQDNRTCAFFLKGQDRGNPIQIVTWARAVFPGT